MRRIGGRRLALRRDRAGARDSIGDGPWPTPAQELLLQAALRRDSAALAAWQRWTATHDLFGADVEPGGIHLLPLVYRNLRGLGADDPAMRMLGGVYRYWWSSNQSRLHRAARVLEELDGEGIRTMVLDGAAMAILYYGDSGVRPIGPVHVMVPVEQARLAVQILRRRGWRDASGRIAEDMRYRPSARILDESGQELELHWFALRDRLDPSIDRGVWRRAVPLVIHGTTTRGLAPSDALLYALMQGMHEGPPGIIGGIADAVAILRASEGRLEWEALAEEAGARRVELPLSRGLDYVEGAFDIGVPEGLRARLRSGTPSRVERLELRYLGGRPGRHSPLARIVALVLEYRRVVGGRSARDKLCELPGFLRYRFRDRVGRMIGVVWRLTRWPGVVSAARRTRRAAPS